jgi:hypothetical protein
MCKKTIVLTCIILLAVSCTALAGVPLKINNKDIQEGQMVALFNDDLEGGKMTISTPAEEGVDGAEVSFDKGRTWEKMERQGDRFIYAHRPRDGDKMNIVFMFKKAGGETSMRSTNVMVYFQKNKPDVAIDLVLQKMRDAYEAEQLGRFMDLFSMHFPNRVRFEQSIQNDFYNYNNIRLYFRVDRALNDPNYKGAIWDVYWERKYMDRSGTEYSDSAHIAMKFNKEADRWLIGAMNGNTIFGSSLLSPSNPPDLVITNAGFIVTAGPNGTGQANVQFTINNVSTAPASNVPVVIYVKKSTDVSYPATPKYTTTITSIGANSQYSSATITLTGLSLVPYDFKIVIDPNNTLKETNTNNNSAERNNVNIPV